MSTILNGCATLTQSTLLGAGTGVAIGAGSGALLDERDHGKGALIGGLAMGLIGSIAGYFTHQGLEKRDAEVRKDTLFNLEKYGVSGFGNSGGDDALAGPGKRKVLIIDDPSWMKNNREQGN